VCPFIPLTGHTWASYLATLGSAHRYNVQRRIRNLDKQFTVRFERARTEDERREALALLVALHNRRWDERGGSESFSTPALLAFYDEVSRRALERDWLRLYVLRLDGEAVAALHGYAYGGTFLFYQAGFDPEYRKHSVGLAIMGLAIKSAVEEGLDEYDLLHGDESYKFQWAPKSRELACLEAFPGSTRGRFGRHAIGAGKALRQRARRLLGNAVADRLIAAMRSTG
jgi:CelD/BcsL family acetyltransferase involved in cellulose biosynthesis